MPPAVSDVRPPKDAELEAFISRHLQLLAQEHAEEEEQTHLLNSNCSTKLLEKSGLALGNLGVSSVAIGLGGKTLVTLHRPLAYHTDTQLPPHTFRNGDPVRIEEYVTESGGKGSKKASKEAEAAGVEGVVFRVSRDKVVVAASGDGKDVELPERLRLVKLANSVTYARMRRTMEHLRRLVLPEQGQNPSATNWPLIHALLGMSKPTWSSAPARAIGADTEEIKWMSPNLNDSQKDAIDFCLRAEQVACIHGPPGTGKTHTLVELIFQLLSRPASSSTTLPPRILVTTPSNLALDNLLLRLHTLSRQPEYAHLLPPGSILRLGHPTRVHRDLVQETLDWRATNGDDGVLVKDIGNEISGHLGDLAKKKGQKGAVKGKERGKKWEEVRELRKEYRTREAKVVTNVVNAASVVLATCHTAGSRQLNNATFDVAIVDEATQAVEAVCWVPILKAKKLVLAGDPQQLPPTIKSQNGASAKSVAKNVTKDAKKKDKATEAADAKEESAAADDDQVAGDAATPSDAKDSDGGKSSLRPPRTLERTLFERLERLYGAGIKRVLKVQYRMNKQIAEFPSKTLYDDELVSDASVAERTLLDLPTITSPPSDDAQGVLEPNVVFFDTAGCEFYERSEADSDTQTRATLGEGSKLNENEATIVAKWARQLVELGVPPAEIGIIAPYQAQVALLASLLREDFPEMTIGTVDGLQGQERDAVIVSLVRSNPKGEVGFLGEYRRLNVAMTRARRQLCVVGDSDTVAKGSSYLKNWMTWLEDNADVRYAGDEI